MRVGVIGAGAVGGPLIEALRRGDIGGAKLSGVLTRDLLAKPGVGLCDLVEQSDLVVEAASQDAVREYGPVVVGAACDLLVVSVGALADEQLAAELGGGPGRLFVCSGAIGGLEILRAAAADGALAQVRLTTRKNPRSLPAAVRGTAPGSDAPAEVFCGTAREAARLFPDNLNVAATLALATVGLDRTVVTLVSDPAAQLTTHTIEASGGIGEYRFEIASKPLPDRPSTSAVVPLAVARAVQSLAGHQPISFV